MVKSAGDEQYAGCTGCPADSHTVKWLAMSRNRPLERCPECGSVYRMEYVGPPDDPHGHDDHGREFPPLSLNILGRCPSAGLGFGRREANECC